MKRIIKRILPDRVISKIKRQREDRRGRREFQRDAARFLRFMTPEDHDAVGSALTGRNLETQITKDYHRVEKGLALRTPKRPFGAEVGARLDALTPAAAGTSYFAHAASARAALQLWNEDATVTDEVSPVRSTRDRGITDIDAFFETRHSVRDFAETPVPTDVLRHATRLAINTPSVCNRQSWQIRYFHGERARQTLALQNGNRGFRQSVPCVALVTVDTRLFSGVGERNQPWIEGGLFSMSLVLALHGLGLDTCMLNMSIRNDKAETIRRELELDEAELIVMMIAIGYGRDGHRRARSPRRSLDEVVRAS